MTPSRIVGGTRGSYGIEEIGLELGEGWGGLAVLVSFYPQEGDPVAVNYTGQPFYLPAEVMACGGTSRFVVSGYRDEKVLITTEGLIRVLDTKLPAENPALLPQGDEVAQFMGFLDGKVDKVSGLGLTQNNYSHEEKAKLAGIEEGAQANVQADWSISDSYAGGFIKNKPSIDTAPASGSNNAVSSGGVFSALTGKADAAHRHEGEYAPAAHSHSGEYATASHEHGGAYADKYHSHSGEYATAAHEHDERYSKNDHIHTSVYSPANHNHENMYAGSSHTHTGIYAPAMHGHGDLYSPLEHSHSGEYAQAVHSHGSSYSPLSHDHDSLYAPRSGFCGGLTAGLAANLAARQELVVDGMFRQRATAAGEKESIISSARILSVSGCTVAQILENGSFADGSGWEAGDADVVIEDNICTVTPLLPEKENGADYSIAVGEKVIIDGYNIWLNTCIPDVEGIVSITELENEEGWEIEGLAAGAVNLTIDEFGTILAELTVGVGAVGTGGGDSGGLLVSRGFECAAGHKYYVRAEIETPGGGGGFAVGIDDGSGEGIAAVAPRGTGWQRTHGILIAGGNYQGRIGLTDKRQISADVEFSGLVRGVSLNTEVFSRRIAAYNTSASGVYRFVYGSGWLRQPSGVPVSKISEYGIEVTWGSESEAERAGSEISINFNYPFQNTAEADITSTGTTGLSGLTIDAGMLAGRLGSDAASGSYIFEYDGIKGWTRDGMGAELAMYGIHGTISGSPQAGATITAELRLGRIDTARIRNLMVFDLTRSGMEDFDTDMLETLLGGEFYERGLHSTVFAGVSCTDINGAESKLTTANHTLHRLPDGTSDVLDYENGVLIRRTTARSLTGGAGQTVFLTGGKSGTSYLCCEGDIGGVSGDTITLSKDVSGAVVIYELNTPETVPLSDGTYAASVGGTETLLRYDGSADKYIPADIAANTVIEYEKDYVAEIESDRRTILGFLTAVGLFSGGGENVAAEALKITNALRSFIVSNGN